MPTPVENLTESSSLIAIRRAISASIEIEVKHGKKPDQAAAIAYSIARKKTGKQIGSEA